MKEDILSQVWDTIKNVGSYFVDYFRHGFGLTSEQEKRNLAYAMEESRMAQTRSIFDMYHDESVNLNIPDFQLKGNQEIDRNLYHEITNVNNYVYNTNLNVNYGITYNIRQVGLTLDEVKKIVEERIGSFAQDVKKAFENFSQEVSKMIDNAKKGMEEWTKIFFEDQMSNIAKRSVDYLKELEVAMEDLIPDIERMVKARFEEMTKHIEEEYPEPTPRKVIPIEKDFEEWKKKVLRGR